MWFLTALTYLSVAVQACLITLSLAAGLYYLAELVEEYTTTACKIIRGTVAVSLVVYIGLLCFENLPKDMLVLGLVAQVVHLSLLKTFPVFYWHSPSFIVAVVLLVVNHYYAFTYFAHHIHSFQEVVAYFLICLWMVPFAFFVSLTANDYVLPSYSEKSHMSADTDVVSHYFSTGNRQKRYSLLALFNYVQELALGPSTQRRAKRFS
jgi:hypothetical protein